MTGSPPSIMEERVRRTVKEDEFQISVAKAVYHEKKEWSGRESTRHEFRAGLLKVWRSIKRLASRSRVVPKAESAKATR